jgi:AcrR family transcriptional regulator
MPVPTGIAIADVRGQLFGAAERVLLRDGPNALTNRAVTSEAGCANGVLHRHFADFGTFLAEFVLDRVSRIGDQAAALRNAAGTGTVTGNLTDALLSLFGSSAMAVFCLVTSRDDLRTRLRQARPGGVPVLSEAEKAISSYLAAEQELGRITPGADIPTTALTLAGAAHLLFARSEGSQLQRPQVSKIVTALISPISTPPSQPPHHPRQE